jgi:hypothetical protein
MAVLTARTIQTLHVAYSVPVLVYSMVSGYVRAMCLIAQHKQCVSMPFGIDGFNRYYSMRLCSHTEHTRCRCVHNSGPAIALTLRHQRATVDSLLTKLCSYAYAYAFNDVV